MKLVVQKITKIDVDILNTITDWMYNWWGISEGYTYEAVKCYVENSFQTDRLPQTYGMYLNDILIGMYQFTYDDLFARPDIYPWLANVYVDEKYRNMGYGKYLINSIKDNARENLGFGEIYLFTKHQGLYEKYGWKFVCEIDTFNDISRIERLYKLDLK